MKLFNRIVAFLLIPCLIGDPAGPHFHPPAGGDGTPPLQYCFRSKALAEQPISGKDIIARRPREGKVVSGNTGYFPRHGRDWKEIPEWIAAAGLAAFALCGGMDHPILALLSVITIAIPAAVFAGRQSPRIERYTMEVEDNAPYKIFTLAGHQFRFDERYMNYLRQDNLVFPMDENVGGIWHEIKNQPMQALILGVFNCAYMILSHSSWPEGEKPVLRVHVEISPDQVRILDPLAREMIFSGGRVGASFDQPARDLMATFVNAFLMLAYLPAVLNPATRAAALHGFRQTDQGGRVSALQRLYVSPPLRPPEKPFSPIHGSIQISAEAKTLHHFSGSTATLIVAPIQKLTPADRRQLDLLFRTKPPDPLMGDEGEWVIIGTESEGPLMLAKSSDVPVPPEGQAQYRKLADRVASDGHKLINEKPGMERLVEFAPLGRARSQNVDLIRIFGLLAVHYGQPINHQGLDPLFPVRVDIPRLAGTTYLVHVRYDEGAAGSAGVGNTSHGSALVWIGGALAALTALARNGWTQVRSDTGHPLRTKISLVLFAVLFTGLIAALPSGRRIFIRISSRLQKVFRWHYGFHLYGALNGQWEETLARRGNTYSPTPSEIVDLMQLMHAGPTLHYNVADADGRRIHVLIDSARGPITPPDETILLQEAPPSDQNIFRPESERLLPNENDGFVALYGETRSDEFRNDVVAALTLIRLLEGVRLAIPSDMYDGGLAAMRPRDLNREVLRAYARKWAPEKTQSMLGLATSQEAKDSFERLLQAAPSDGARRLRRVLMALQNSTNRLIAQAVKRQMIDHPGANLLIRVSPPHLPALTESNLPLLLEPIAWIRVALQPAVLQEKLTLARQIYTSCWEWDGFGARLQKAWRVLGSRGPFDTYAAEDPLRRLEILLWSFGRSALGRSQTGGKTRIEHLQSTLNFLDGWEIVNSEYGRPSWTVLPLPVLLALWWRIGLLSGAHRGLGARLDGLFDKVPRFIARDGFGKPRGPEAPDAPGYARAVGQSG